MIDHYAAAERFLDLATTRSELGMQVRKLHLGIARMHLDLALAQIAAAAATPQRVMTSWQERSITDTDEAASHRLDPPGYAK